MAEETQISSIVVGYRNEMHPSARQMLRELTPPKSMKKQETIDAWLADKQQLFEVEASRLKITGQIAEVVAVDLTAGKLFDTKRLKKDGPWGVAFARWLLDTRGHRNAIPNRHHGGDYGVAFFGFDLKPFFRVLGVECNTADFEVPLGLWYANDVCFDPYAMLTECDHGGIYREMFSLAKVMARGGLTLKDYRLGQNPKNDTRVVMEMISRFRLTSTLDLANVRKVLTSKAFSTQALDDPGEDSVAADGVGVATPTSGRKSTKKSAKKKGS